MFGGVGKLITTNKTRVLRPFVDYVKNGTQGRPVFLERNFTNSTNATNFFAESRRQEDVGIISLLVAIIVIIGLVALVGNIVVLLAIAINKKLRKKPSTVLTASLTGSGLVTAVFTMPLAIFNLTRGLSTAEFSRIMMCRALTVSILLGGCSALFSIVEHTIDRYLLVMHPLFYRRRITMRLMKMIVLLTWFLSLIIALFPMWQRTRYDSRLITSCSGFINSFVNTTLGTVFFYVLPLALVVIIYFRLYLVIKQKSRRLFSMRNQLPFATEAPSRGLTTSEIKAIKTIGLVVWCHTLMWCPLIVLQLYEAHCNFCLTFSDRLPVLIISFSVHAVHPFIYAYNEEYKKTYHKVFCMRDRTAVSSDNNLNMKVFSIG